MFGWEYPPHVYGGLATANFGITEGLHAQGDVDITLCLPHPFGDEDQSYCRIVTMNRVPIVWRDVDYGFVEQRLGGLMTPDYYYRLRDHIYADFGHMNVNELGAMEFAGGYPANLHEEINNYSIIAGVVARTEDFDIIHAHDWLTFPAGIHAKQVSGKPLCIHVHATDFDRSRGQVNPTVYAIEKDGMDNADCIMCVSELTRQTVINQYHQGPAQGLHGPQRGLSAQAGGGGPAKARPSGQGEDRDVSRTHHHAEGTGIFCRGGQPGAPSHERHPILHGGIRRHDEPNDLSRGRTGHLGPIPLPGIHARQPGL